MAKMKMEDVYSETYAVFLMLGEDYISKIPADIWDKIETSRNPDYNPVIDENKALNEQGLSSQTIALVFVLKRDYFCRDEEDRADLMRILEENDRKFNEQLANASSLKEKLKLIQENE